MALCGKFSWDKIYNDLTYEYIYEGSSRSTRPNKENTKNLEKTGLFFKVIFF